MATDGEDQPMILHSVQASTWGAIRVANDAYPATTAEARSVGLPSDSEVLRVRGRDAGERPRARTAALTIGFAEETLTPVLTRRRTPFWA